MIGTLQCMTTKARKPVRRTVDAKNIFVIFGNQNSGKTHTAWLIYNLLKKNGYDILGLFKTRSDQEILTYNDVLEHIRASFEDKDTIAISDFRAMLEINGKRVGIFSAGDYVDDDWGVTSFKKNMKWAQDNEADFIVCCARSYNRTNSVHKLLKEKYANKIFKWYPKGQFANNLQEQLADAENVANEVLKDLTIFLFYRELLN